MHCSSCGALVITEVSTDCDRCVYPNPKYRRMAILGRLEDAAGMVLPAIEHTVVPVDIIMLRFFEKEE